MSNNSQESKKFLLGVVVGGAVGVTISCLIHAAQNKQTPVLQKIGKTIAEVGEMLESCDIGGSDMVKKIEKNLPATSDVLSTAADWVNTGISLWKNFKKGM